MEREGPVSSWMNKRHTTVMDKVGEITISIRPLRFSEYHACEVLQRQVWAMPDDLDVVPLHLLMSVQKQGGLLLGAFDGDNLVGFVFGFPGFQEDGHVKHCSHMMGVASAYRSQGIGYRLKLAQRESILSQGLDLVTWTYDPLESRNAHLNIRKLGAVCRTYIRDLYGPMTDALNVGLPSDRFQVEWWAGSDRVGLRLRGESLQPPLSLMEKANSTELDGEDPLAPGALVLDIDAEMIAVEIPADYQAIKAAEPDLALEWRLATRQVFETYFRAGYVIDDFVSDRVLGLRRSFYVLRNAVEGLGEE
jgi:predicted GNAT superfamily acetyltransferase